MNWPAIIAMIGFFWMVLLFWFMEYDWRKDTEEYLHYRYSKLTEKEREKLKDLK